MIEQTYKDQFKIFPTNLKAEYLNDKSVTVAKGMMSKQDLLEYAEIHPGVAYIGENIGNKSVINTILQNTLDDSEIAVFQYTFMDATEMVYDENSHTIFARYLR